MQGRMEGRIENWLCDGGQRREVKTAGCEGEGGITVCFERRTRRWKGSGGRRYCSSSSRCSQRYVGGRGAESNAGKNKDDGGKGWRWSRGRLRACSAWSVGFRLASGKSEAYHEKRKPASSGSSSQKQAGAAARQSSAVVLCSHTPEKERTGDGGGEEQELQVATGGRASVDAISAVWCVYKSSPASINSHNQQSRRLWTVDRVRGRELEQWTRVRRTKG